MSGQLVIAIEYDVAPRAEDIGALFSALAKDYKRTSKGRVLAVATITQGSITATLVDWASKALPYINATVEFARGVKAIADFSKLLIDGIKAITASPSTADNPPAMKKSSVARSINAMIKTAAENGSGIRIEYVGENGESLKAEMTPGEALVAKARATQNTVQAQEEQNGISAKSVLVPRNELFDRLYSAEAADYSVTDINAIVDALFNALSSIGQTELVPTIAADLSRKGLFNLANALLAKLPGRQLT